MVLQKCSEEVSVDGLILKAESVQFNRLLGEEETFRAYERWLWRGSAWDMTV